MILSSASQSFIDDSSTAAARERYFFDVSVEDWTLVPEDDFVCPSIHGVFSKVLAVMPPRGS